MIHIWSKGDHLDPQTPFKNGYCHCRKLTGSFPIFVVAASSSDVFQRFSEAAGKRFVHVSSEKRSFFSQISSLFFRARFFQEMLRFRRVGSPWRSISLLKSISNHSESSGFHVLSAPGSEWGVTLKTWFPFAKRTLLFGVTLSLLRIKFVSSELSDPVRPGGNSTSTLSCGFLWWPQS